MRVPHGVLIAALLLACDADGGGPVQPEAEAARSVPAPDAAGEDGAAVTDEDIRPTRGFYVDGFPNGGSTISIGTDFTEIQRYGSLPAGKYIATASAVLASNGVDVHNVDCIFTIGGTIRGELARGMVGGTIADNMVSLPLTIGFAITSPTDLGVACRAGVQGVVFTQASPITAIRLDRLTTQHP